MIRTIFAIAYPAYPWGIRSREALQQARSKPLGLLAFACAWMCVCAFGADADHCGICGKAFGPTIYTTTDHVTHEKVFLCYACAVFPDECYICGLPAVLNPVKLPDGRFLCARDAKDAVLDESKATALCDEVRDKIDRLFSRFLTLPST